MCGQKRKKQLVRQIRCRYLLDPRNQKVVIKETAPRILKLLVIPLQHQNNQPANKRRQIKLFKDTNFDSKDLRKKCKPIQFWHDLKLETSHH